MLSTLVLTITTAVATLKGAKLYLYGAFTAGFLAALVVAFGAGYMRARANCAAENLNAQLEEAYRQIAILRDAQMLADKQLEEYRQVEAENQHAWGELEMQEASNGPDGCVTADGLRTIHKLR